MISRHWRGIAKREDADSYVAHLKGDTFPKLASLAGFVRASILRREVPNGTEFQVVTVWESCKRSEHSRPRMLSQPSFRLWRKP